MNNNTYRIHEITKKLIDKEINVSGTIRKVSEHKVRKTEEGFEDYLEITIEDYGQSTLILELIYENPIIFNIIDYYKNHTLEFQGTLKYIKKKSTYQPILILDNFPIDENEYGRQINLPHHKVFKIIENLSINNFDITFEDILKELKKIGFTEDDTKECLNRLRQEGLIFEPRQKIYRTLN